MTLRELIDCRHPFGVPTSRSSALTGMKKSVWDGFTLWISPAMETLLADETLMEMLMDKIEVVHIPRLDIFDLPLLSVSRPANP